MSRQANIWDVHIQHDGRVKHAERARPVITDFHKKAKKRQINFSALFLKWIPPLYSYTLNVLCWIYVIPSIFLLPEVVKVTYHPRYLWTFTTLNQSKLENMCKDWGLDYAANASVQSREWPSQLNAKASAEAVFYILGGSTCSSKQWSASIVHVFILIMYATLKHFCGQEAAAGTYDQTNSACIKKMSYFKSPGSTVTPALEVWFSCVRLSAASLKSLWTALCQTAAD